MAPATKEALSKGIRKAKRIRIVRDRHMEEREALSLFADASPKGGYIDDIRTIIKRNWADNKKYFLIAALDLETNEAITDPVEGKKMAQQANIKLAAKNSPMPVRWVTLDEKGNPLNKLLAIPADKFKPLRSNE